METYHKIQTAWLRDPATNNKTLLEGRWAKPEFEFLKDLDWVWTEKIDGTNIRVMWDGARVSFAGKTDSAQMPPGLPEVLAATFTADKMKAAFPDADNVCLYGEGYGYKIQSGGSYLRDRNDFILFDCRIDDWWLTRESLEDISHKLQIAIVPVIGVGSLQEAIAMVKKGFKSTIAQNKDLQAEGLVMKPAVELFNRRGERVISKIKHKDFPRS